MNDKKIKVNISISPKIKALAQDKIEMFAGNFSAYITHLIIRDVEQNKIRDISEMEICEASKNLVNYTKNKSKNR